MNVSVLINVFTAKLYQLAPKQFVSNKLIREKQYLQKIRKICLKTSLETVRASSAPVLLDDRTVLLRTIWNKFEITILGLAGKTGNLLKAAALLKINRQCSMGVWLPSPGGPLSLWPGLLQGGCCIFQPAFGCCALKMLVKIVIFSIFSAKKS